MNHNNSQTIDDYFRAKNWAYHKKSNEGYPIYKYENGVCKLWILVAEDKGLLIYGFEEDEITSIVKIDYKDNLLRLLDLINAYGKKMSSSYYHSQLSSIADEFPKMYFLNNDVFTPLEVLKDDKNLFGIR